MPEAACLYLPYRGKVLSVSRKYDGFAFGMPGGKVERGESPKQAAARECWEETTVVCSGLKLLFESPNNNYYVYTFLAGRFVGVPTDQGVGSVMWIEPERLLLGAYPEYVRKMFKAFEALPEKLPDAEYIGLGDPMKAKKKFLRK